MNTEAKRYFVQIRLGNNPTRQRIAEAASGVKDLIERLSYGTYQLVFASGDGCNFGFFLKTKRHARSIRSQLECPGGMNRKGEVDEQLDRIPPPLTNEDSILIVEIGEDFDGVGFSRAWTWLQHH